MIGAGSRECPDEMRTDGDRDDAATLATGPCRQPDMAADVAVSVGVG